MNREDLVAVAARLFSVYLAVTAIFFLASLVSMNYHEAGTVPLASIIAAAIVAFIVCALLWFFPLSIARRLLPAMRDSESGIPIGLSNVLSIGLTLLGVWLLAQSVPDVIYWSIYWKFAHASGDPSMALQAPEIARMVSAGARLVIAILLIVGSARLQHMLHRLRFGAAADGF